MSKIEIILICVYLIGLIISVGLTEYILGRNTNRFQILIYWLFCLVPMFNMLLAPLSLIAYFVHNQQKIEKIIKKCSICYKILNYLSYQPFNK